ncbi:hypothetical protein K493DRAFT_98039 [Basidiobolus meristosporus CBS 931.73]|uniref:N-formylglutamate amidohydrolase n=1 Tax=Basidiobolus meristosporus CBS 931.73 TaxID=1314790 RepID=A0A1Y1YSU0_9FUNG|nr:hypothetical protein K493DRAFT_98039 [Basidiobolus meristosporus CBS 931.73]|eukprot:ORY01098.1 hypothetical protein K493DRAFT_98039 [Basidiobolus meristosporus CBS 931.73]
MIHQRWLICCLLVVLHPGIIYSLTRDREFVLSAPHFASKATDEYVEFVRGDFPLVITAPHGGYLFPVSFPDRRKSPQNRLLGDIHTQEIARELVEHLSSLGRRPYLIICHLSRKKVDVNREPGSQAYDNLKAARVYNEYHEKVLLACKEVQELFGRGLYLDIHGQRHPENWIELGYLLGKDQLQLPDDRLNMYGGSFSLSRLLNNSLHFQIADLLRHNNSFGGLLGSLGYKTVPSPQYPSPNNGSYYRGGYSTDRYWRIGGLDTIQVELPASIRFHSGNRVQFVKDFAQATLVFGGKWYGWPSMLGNKAKHLLW